MNRRENCSSFKKLFFQSSQLKNKKIPSSQTKGTIKTQKTKDKTRT